MLPLFEDGYEEISVQNGIKHFTWHFFDPNNRTTKDPLSDAIDQWSCLANNALLKGHQGLGTLAKHVSFSLRVASFRLPTASSGSSVRIGMRRIEKNELLRKVTFTDWPLDEREARHWRAVADDLSSE